MRSYWSALALLIALAGCAQPAAPQLAMEQTAAVESAVRAQTEAIARDLADDGPNGWLRHFVDDGTFFMASDGKLQFSDFATATDFVHTLDERIASMRIEWRDLRVDVLSSTMAVWAAGYDESLTETSGAEFHYAGYVTALAVETPSGWKIRHLHWSSPAAQR